MPEIIHVSVNGIAVAVESGTTVAAAVLQCGISSFRRSVTGEPRGPLCGMGICFECRVTVDRLAHAKSCQTLCTPGMEITTDE
ncbi:MAG: ferredoxin [Acidobacteria bacterium]|nr:MAG: ferredoxin [Acidobacteriota bacterium]PYY10014.1 MAG: ferredoxin [Acidobacteriota bacterium]